MLKQFPARNRARIRNLLLVAQPRGIAYNQSYEPNHALWKQVLPKLVRLGIIAEEPVEAAQYFGAPTLETEKEQWLSWIKCVLSCIGTYVSEDAAVYVDVGGRTETSKMFREYLPHGYKEGGCGSLADLIFKRGRLSLESGYWADDGEP